VNLSPFKYLKEFSVFESTSYEIGQKFTVEMFEIGQKINVSGLTIGKGYGGNIKKNGFTRGGMSHGSKHHRLQGSIGSGTTPGRVFPGKKMSGHLGMERRTVQGLEIIDIDTKENLIVIKGCIPGKSGNLLTVTVKN
jgi:large subunit ribosomal protein L3